MKVLKFRDNLVPLVISGYKNSTWRLFDDKDLAVGDEVELREFNANKSFAKAVVTAIAERTFKELTDEDKKGHETFSSDEEMYKTYSYYYGVRVSPDTNLKIIWFELVKLL